MFEFYEIGHAFIRHDTEKMEFLSHSFVSLRPEQRFRHLLLVVCLLFLWVLTLATCTPAVTTRAPFETLQPDLPATLSTTIAPAGFSPHTTPAVSVTPLRPKQFDSPVAVTSSPLLGTPVQPPSAKDLANVFIQSRVGESYFRAHYVLVEVRAVAPNQIKGTYRYTYMPHVQDYVLTLFITADGKSLASSEVTVALLEPQEFVIDQARAIDLAVKNGAGQSNDVYRTSLLLNQRTRNRFAWRVVNETLLKNQAANLGRIYAIVLDVETGEPYIKELLGVSESH